MINLAGNKDCDRIIKDELERACIPISFEFAPLNSEVHYSKVGYLANGKIKFTRAWTYWVVEGKIPAEIAWKIYNHPEGKKTVRIGGHCGCPSPAEYGLTWFDSKTGQIIVSQEEYAKIQNICQKYEEKVVNNYTPDIGQPKTQYATLYHIDEQAGLLLFSMLINGEY